MDSTATTSAGRDGDRQQAAVLDWLCDPATHGAEVRRIDTHGAIVVLAGTQAYKIKRAVRFPFMDYSTLEKRRAACVAEIAVNRAFAPAIYRDAIAVVRRPDGALALGGEGEPLEWVVAMRRFDEAATFDRLAEAGPLPPPVLADLAAAVAASHAAAPVRPAGPALASLRTWLAQNREALEQRPDLFDPDDARTLCDVAEADLARLAPLIAARGEAGRVRRCHGDLHLRNIALIDGRATLFDAIEFDDAVATGDVLYDLAFLLMDLMERGHAAEANRVMNRYLWASDPCDAAGVAALPFFLALRAVIRAKVVAAGETAQPPDRRAAVQDEARRYFAFARAIQRPEPARLVAVGGLSGTGKSTLAAALASRLGHPPGAVHLRTDVERKRLAGVAPEARLPRETYTREASDRVYARVRDLAAAVLGGGFAVVVDAVHATPAERQAIADVAREAGVRFDGLWLQAPPATLLDRVARRTGDASDADPSVVRGQLDFDVGPLDWPRIDAGGDGAAVADAALSVLGLPDP